MSRQPALPKLHPMSPWTPVGDVPITAPAVLAHYALPPLYEAVRQPAGRVGVVGLGSWPERLIDGGSVSRMSEETLIRAHRHCPCCPEPERMPWEDWSEGQWEWYRRRQKQAAARARRAEAQGETA